MTIPRAHVFFSFLIYFLFVGCMGCDAFVKCLFLSVSVSLFFGCGWVRTGAEVGWVGLGADRLTIQLDKGLKVYRITAGALWNKQNTTRQGQQALLILASSRGYRSVPKIAAFLSHDLVPWAALF